MKGPLNAKLNVGDVIMLLHMEGETSVPPGTIGVVKKIGRDPFEIKDESIVSVEWENGSTLNLLTTTDAWKKITPNITEQTDDGWNYITQNEDIFENFDWKWLREFLYKMRDTGIINMLGAAPLLYAGKEHIDRYYGEGKEDDEKFQDFLNESDEAKNKIVQGVINYMIRHNKDLNDMELVNRYARHFSQKIVGLYVVFSRYQRQN